MHQRPQGRIDGVAVQDGELHLHGEDGGYVQTFDLDVNSMVALEEALASFWSGKDFESTWDYDT